MATCAEIFVGSSSQGYRECCSFPPHVKLVYYQSCETEMNEEGSSSHHESVSIDHINNVEATTAIEIDIDGEDDDCWRTSKKRDDGIVYYMLIACSREGCHVSSIPSTLKTLPTKTKGCPAKITKKLEEDDLWYVKKVELEHNHDVSPTSTRKMPTVEKVVKKIQKRNKQRGQNLTIQEDIDLAIGKNDTISNFCESLLISFVMEVSWFVAEFGLM
ncbi:hypothetical protein RIF29_18329 [Crotalaria pallida]|uniref:FAR1 domain-containing protein n=1 Tax=Crotalaria pallida TaxID=3830 RepID=A0AAN9IDT4_CROPI